jgi:hypothetical protein
VLHHSLFATAFLRAKYYSAGSVSTARLRDNARYPPRATLETQAKIGRVKDTIFALKNVVYYKQLRPSRIKVLIITISTSFHRPLLLKPGLVRP